MLHYLPVGIEHMTLTTPGALSRYGNTHKQSQFTTISESHAPNILKTSAKMEAISSRNSCTREKSGRNISTMFQKLVEHISASSSYPAEEEIKPQQVLAERLLLHITFRQKEGRKGPLLPQQRGRGGQKGAGQSISPGLQLCSGP